MRMSQNRTSAGGARSGKQPESVGRPSSTSDAFSPPRRPTLLVILDGFGVNPSKANNAIHHARTPRLDHYFARFPHTVLDASGAAVGLPIGQMGNSEVGHITL